jgi:glycerol kinase
VNRGVLALDQGSHASRACIFDARGALLASATVPVATRHPAPMRVEQDAAELLDSVRTAAAQALHAARAQQPGLELVAAGLAVQRSTLVCCSRRDGSALTPALSWQDQRNAAWLARLAACAPRVRELTGLPMSPHYGASKLRWCLEHLAPVARAAAAGDLLAAPLASYLAWQLCAPRAAPRVDAANASRTLLFDSTQLDWSDELLRIFAIERAWLPDCAPTRADWGTLHIAGSAVPLRALTGDQSAVPFAAGDAASDTVYVNLGTGAFIQRPLRMRPPAPAPLLGSVLCNDPGARLYSLEGTVNGAGSAVSWFREQEHCDEPPLWAALEAMPAHCALPVFLNGVGGLGSPWWRPAMEPRYLAAVDAAGAGPAPAARLARFAALVESIAFMIAVNAELLEAQAGPPRRVLLAGGMSRSAWLCRRLAALLDLPVEVIDAEASARGVARLAAPDFTATWPTPASARHAPDPDAALRERYGRFTAGIAAAP